VVDDGGDRLGGVAAAAVVGVEDVAQVRLGARRHPGLTHAVGQLQGDRADHEPVQHHRHGVVVGIVHRGRAGGTKGVGVDDGADQPPGHVRTVAVLQDALRVALGDRTEHEAIRAEAGRGVVHGTGR